MKDDRPLKYRWLEALESDHGPRPTARHIGLVLASFMQEDGSGCRPGQRRIAARTGRTQKTVGEAIRQLEAEGWLVRTKRSKNPKDAPLYTPGIPVRVSTLLLHDASTQLPHDADYVSTELPHDARSPLPHDVSTSLPHEEPRREVIDDQNVRYPLPQSTQRDLSTASTQPSVTTKSRASEPTAEGKSITNVSVTDSKLRDEAITKLGLGRFAGIPDQMRVSKEIQALLHTGIERENLLAALRGVAQIRDAGLLGFAKGQPYTPGVLARWGKVWWGEGDARAERPLIEVAQQVERTGELASDDGIVDIGQLLRGEGGAA